MGLSLPLPHYPALLRARREIIPSCSGVTGTTEGGGNRSEERRVGKECKCQAMGPIAQAA